MVERARSIGSLPAVMGTIAEVLARSCNNSVARSIGIVSAAIRSVSTGGSCSHRSSSDTYRHPAAHGCTTVNATAIDTTAIDTTMVNASAADSNASSICEGVG
jgi:hypothetical protein